MEPTMQETPTAAQLEVLEAVTALADSWRDAPQTRIAASMADALMQNPALDVVYVRLSDGADSTEAARGRLGWFSQDQARYIGLTLDRAAGQLTHEKLCTLSNLLPDEMHTLAAVPVGKDASHGIVAAASQAGGFPWANDWLSLHVAANQAMVALQGRSSQWEDAEVGRHVGEAFRDVQHANLSLLEAGLLAQENAESATRDRVQLDQLLSGLTEGMVIIQPPDQIRFMNPAAKNIAALPQTYASDNGLPDVEWLFPGGEPVPPEQRPYRRAGRGESLDDEEFAIGDGDQQRFVIFNSNAISAQDGEVLLAIVTSRDITALRRLEQLREDDAALVSHDLRNPLLVAIGAARRFEAHAKSGEDQEMCDLLIGNLFRMNSMIDDIIDANYSESGRMNLELEPVSLAPLIRDTVSSWRDGKNRIVVREGDDNAIVPGDKVRLERVLSNLLANALRYSPDESPVTVSLRVLSGEAVVSVSDVGPGIEPSELEAVFERYHTAGGDSSQLHHGLGLYSARLIVEAHGGRIWAESSVGKGSTFLFTVSLESAV